MGRLQDFLSYLADRRAIVDQIEQRLCDLQAHYETFFAEVSKVRDAELGQLIEHTLSDRSCLPDWYNAAVDTQQVEVEKELDARLQTLVEERDRLEQEAEAERARSAAAEQEMRARNLELDTEEERLKQRNHKLLSEITTYNEQIRELGRGFGFFAGFFKMRRLARQRQALDREQADVAARIEGLRARWQAADQEHATAEAGRRSSWVELETRAGAASAKLDALREAWPSIVARSTVERVLEKRALKLPEGEAEERFCPRCSTLNPAANHFCHICAVRLGQDRPDFAGSVEEMAELNRHHRQFSEGMRACQEIIGLVRGLGSGIDAFTKSVEDVQASEKKYPLPKLNIDVPAASVEYGSNFDRFKAAVDQDLKLHPKVFADQVGALVHEAFTEEAIKTYFETMGQELSRQAEAQW